MDKVGIDGTYPKIIKVTWNKHIANIISNGDELKIFSLKSEMIQGCSSTLPCHIWNSTQILSYTNQIKALYKRITIEKEGIKPSLLTEDIIPYFKNPLESIRKPLDLIVNISSKVIARYKISMYLKNETKLPFIYTSRLLSEKIRENIPLKIGPPTTNQVLLFC